MAGRLVDSRAGNWDKAINERGTGGKRFEHGWPNWTRGMSKPFGTGTGMQGPSQLYLIVVNYISNQIRFQSNTLAIGFDCC